MADEFPYMPVYWRDWLTGQSTSDLNAEQDGAFFNLLLHAWGRDPACEIPNDSAWLAARSKLGSRFAKVWPTIAPMFDVLSNGNLRNPKQWRVFQDMVMLREKRRGAGSKGGKSRVENQANEQAKTQANPQAQGQVKTNPSVAVAVAVAGRDVTEAVSTKPAGAAEVLDFLPGGDSQPLHAYFMPILRELGYEADDHDGSILKALEGKRVPREEMENAIRGLAVMRKAGELDRPLHIPTSGKLSMRILYTPKPGKFEAQPWWNRALQAYWKDLERGSRGLRKVSL
jgi:uncharacterized protein YdaU (DUF1376 family)